MARNKQSSKKKAPDSPAGKTSKKVPKTKKPPAKAKAKTKPKAAPRKAPIKPEDKPLTDKEQLFVSWYVSDIVNCNATEAARRAGYSGTENSIRVTACKLLTKANVRKAVDAELKAATNSAGVTVESTLRKLAEIRERAIEAEQYGPAAKAAELQGKYLKMFTDKIEHTVTMDQMSMDDLVRLAELLAQEAGIDIRKLFTGK
jgi:phage terminase small subunit